MVWEKNMMTSLHVFSQHTFFGNTFYDIFLAAVQGYTHFFSVLDLWIFQNQSRTFIKLPFNPFEQTPHLCLWYCWWHICVSKQISKDKKVHYWLIQIFSKIIFFKMKDDVEVSSKNHKHHKTTTCFYISTYHVVALNYLQFLYIPSFTLNLISVTFHLSFCFCISNLVSHLISSHLISSHLIWIILILHCF